MKVHIKLKSNRFFLKLIICDSRYLKLCRGLFLIIFEWLNTISCSCMAHCSSERFCIFVLLWYHAHNWSWLVEKHWTNIIFQNILQQHWRTTTGWKQVWFCCLCCCCWKCANLLLQFLPTNYECREILYSSMLSYWFGGSWLALERFSWELL